MRERRKGPIARAAGIAEGVAAAMRRAQREREPRALLYDESGHARLLQPNARGHEHVLEIAQRMVALVEEAQEDPARRSRPRRLDADEEEPADDAG